MRIATVSKEVQFDAGHRVPYHESKCKHPHGHRYRVVLHVMGPIVDDRAAQPDSGMVIDFGDVKRLLTEEAHDRFDHAFIVWEHDGLMRAAFDTLPPDLQQRVVVVPFIPTAENLATYLHDVLSRRVRETFPGTNGEVSRVFVSRIEVWETPTSCAVVGAA